MSDAATTTAGTVSGGTTSARAGLDSVLKWVRRKPLLPLLIAGAAVIAIAMALLLWAGSPDYRLLYGNLSNADGGKIIAALDQQNVPYKFAQGGHALLVPADKVYTLRLQLAEKGLPSTGNVGFKIMDNEPFGISQFAEQVNFLRGLQGELANSIAVLAPVADARVHLALPKKSMFVRKRKPAKATVVLTLKPGRMLSVGQVNAIMHMVASSVRDLSPDNVTVVDQSGQLLTRNGVDNGLDGTQLDYLHKVEASYRRRIEDILTPIVGAGNVHAQVTAQLDFSKREETKEHYGPNQGDNPAAVRSRQQSTSWNDGAGRNAGGIPGALTNTPPGAAASPINNPPAQANANAAAGAVAGTATNPATTTAAAQQHDNMQRQDTTNYEVDHNITHIKHDVGTLQRLSVAVVVNYRDLEQEDGSTKAIPLSATTMQQITELTRQTMGFSTPRGDSLEVVNSDFQTPAEPPTPVWWKSLDWPHLLATLGRYLVVLIIVILLYRTLLRPLLKQHKENLAAAAAPPPSADASGSAQADEEEESLEEGQTPPVSPRRRRNRAATYQESLVDLKQMAEKDPGMVAMIVRNWIKRDGT